MISDYSRQMRLAGVGESGQLRLSRSSVLILGAGGLGCVVAPLLAGAGIGRLTLVDHDRLEVSNLHRQTLYRRDQIGEYKAELAVQAVRELNPDVSATAVTGKLIGAELLEQMEGHDLVLECTDDFANKLMVSDAAVALSKSAVFANAVQREGQLQTYTGEPDAACLRCLWHEVPGNTPTCEQTGVLGSAAATIGAMQATEALQMLLAGQPGFVYEGLKNRVLYYDFSSYQQRVVRLNISAECAAHQTTFNREAFMSQHQPMEFSGSFEEAEKSGFRVVDIRDPATAAQAPLPVACEILTPNEVAEMLQTEPDGSPLLLVCYAGRTSLGVAAQLRELGFNQVFSKVGGAASG
ncbi:MAG: ThiF family adenylyltransferase [bacterium]